SRIGNQIRGLERKVADLKDVNVRKELEIKRKAKQEVENIRDSYQKNIESYEQQKKAAVDLYNERNAKDINDIRKELSGQMVEQSRFYRRNQSVENARNREAMDQLMTDFEARQTQTKQQANERVAVVRDDSANQVERMREHYETKVSAERATNAEEELDLRQKLAQEKSQAIERMRSQVREEEIRHEREMNQLKTAYEKRIAKANDMRVRENEGQKAREKRLVKDMSRLHENQLASQKIQYEERMAEMNERHQKELQTIQQRHNDRIDQMAVVTKKT
ncbi:MAG: hypothetical protein KDD43_11255, partial [Bdellovibrionales bacterium]|nr:hypothetical protein [Bdellovibrionales bacterium]